MMESDDGVAVHHLTLWPLPVSLSAGGVKMMKLCSAASTVVFSLLLAPRALAVDEQVASLLQHLIVDEKLAHDV